ncbi:odorant-binding protein 19c isoform X2 [Choristoneura fumiferana]|uniref:odorant-binding protein 19c isoform X2 n=1 Tax=Choristoneura fumiferana TaxID=7141 RepID=UPI003D15991E
METLFFLLLLLGCAYARISVMYAHDKLSDIVAEACLNEMYPKTKRLELQESDEQCIIFCVLKKFGIMNSNGVFNLDSYKKRVQVANQLERVNMVRDFGSTCMENAEATQNKQDVCRKAKVFNDCTHLYRILLRK